MKRNDLLAATLVLAASLALGPALRGADPVPQCPNCPNCPATKTADKAKATKETKEKLVQELVSILNETKSPDTFAVTASCLGMMGHDARPAVPAIIRNAERLGLLKGISEFLCDEEEESKPSKQQKMAEGIMDCLDQILSKQPSGPKPPQSYQPCATLPVPMVCPAPAFAVPENIGFPVLPPPPPPVTPVPPPARQATSTPAQPAPQAAPPAKNAPPDTCPFSFILGFMR